MFIHSSQSPLAITVCSEQYVQGAAASGTARRVLCRLSFASKVTYMLLYFIGEGYWGCMHQMTASMFGALATQRLRGSISCFEQSGTIITLNQHIVLKT